MKAAALSFMLFLAFLAAHSNAWARDAVLPAGTLVQCTLNEPRFSSATASVGDPVLCYPHGLQVFGQTVFPRGAYIVGHLADDKDPGHFWGKGNLHLEFDRIGLPSADVPLTAKIISVSGGYRVDKEGKIIGKGHATRDTIEWLFPPLWPWKVISLPMRGPRPTLKGETRVTLRLMDDVLIPDVGQYRRFGQLNSGSTYEHPALYLRPQQQLTPPSGLARPDYHEILWRQQTPETQTATDSRTAVSTASDSQGDHEGWHKFGRADARANTAGSDFVPAGNVDAGLSAKTSASDNAVLSTNGATSGVAAPAVDDIALTAVASDAQPSQAPANVLISAVPAPEADASATVRTVAAGSTAAPASAKPAQKPALTLFALQAGTVYAVADYWRDEDRLGYVLANGKEGQVDLNELDWKTTTQLNAERSVKVTLRDGR